MANQDTRNWKYPQLHEDAPPVPDGLRPKHGVEYGCGKAECPMCYEPEPTAQYGSIANPAR